MLLHINALTLFYYKIVLAVVPYKLKFVSAIEYPFNTQSLFFFTQIMTAITIIGIILIIPIYAGPSIAILE
jgi:hypothetical protein